MKKTILLFILFVTIPIFSFSQQIENVQIHTSSVFTLGSTPADPNFYEWEHIDNDIQGVNIDVLNTEIKLVVIQQNNAKLALNTLNHGYGFLKVEIKYDDDEWITVHEGSSIWSVGWLDLPESFQTIGFHNLEVRYLKPGDIWYFREYVVNFVPASSSFHRDNTKSSDPFTAGNTLTVWDSPNQNDETKPMLIIEGYDVSNTNYAEFYRLGGDYLADRLFELNYDIYILNFNLGSAKIKQNAAALHAAIEYISSLNDQDEIAMMGLSMGGLIGRYALAKAEEDGSPLPVSSFTAVDSPHQGAVFDREFQDWIKVETETMGFPSLDNLAAKEMLIYNAFDDANTHDLFFNELNALNGTGYPNSIPTIGIAFSNNQPNPNIDLE